MAGGGGMSSEVSGIERLRENFSNGGVRNPCFSSSVVPWRNEAERKIRRGPEGDVCVFLLFLQEISYLLMLTFIYPGRDKCLSGQMRIVVFSG